MHKQLVVIDVSEDKTECAARPGQCPHPRAGGQPGRGGGLPVGARIYDKVERAERVTVQYLDLDGVERTLEAEGLLAVCIQHELDHLTGKVFVDYLSQLKQTRIKNKLAKQARITA